MRPIQKVQENIVVHLQWEISYFIANYTHSSQADILKHDKIRPLQKVPEIIAFICSVVILLYSSLSPIYHRQLFLKTNR